MGKQPIEARKRPVQARAKATVEAILEAATYILSREGLSAFTTNHIAERAGVNISSLYQYFPCKDAILAELQRRHVLEQRLAGRSVLAGSRGKGLEATVRALVSMGVAVHSVSPKLHAALTEALPGKTAKGHDGVETPLKELADLLTVVVPRASERAFVLWMVETASRAILHRGVVERADDLLSGRVADELTRMLVHYLQSHRRRRRP